MMKQAFQRPPMGWNSYDQYNTRVTEAEILQNARVMADHLKPHGWDYVVVDIQWYADNAAATDARYQYLPFGDVAMDDHARLLPDPVKFPSAANGAGFRPLADAVHALGLKFGIHIMRGIPRVAAHRRMPIWGTDQTADQIADPSAICGWNPDMYGLRPGAGSQAYYDSLLALYAEWGVDYIKCDDICNTNLYPDRYRAAHEIEMLRRAIDRAPREMVLSLSPGPALIEKSWHYARNAHLWRITDDFWDDWTLLKDMFRRCEIWQDHVRMGHYPDCDMLPLGRIGRHFDGERTTRFTPDEQRTMMTLWSSFRSPLMIGADLTQLDAGTLALLQQDELLALNREGRRGRQIARSEAAAIWVSEGDTPYAALFNLADEAAEVAFSLGDVGLSEAIAHELWTGEALAVSEELIARVPAHGVRVYRLARREN
ncbi:MAG: glycoside hydrolase family 27 protein [Oscillospiraceae bacterium]|jgi:hypothetical protein|nr:glycoside hydrolase family 27 protein [Oscillospiraceae bacterium]